VLVLDAFNGGGNQDARFNQTHVTDIRLAERFTAMAGRHTLKAGFELDGTDRRHRDRTNFGGTFIFGADVERNESGLPAPGAGGDERTISPLERYRRTLEGRPGYGPSYFSIVRGDPDVRFRQWWGGAFIQDEWAAARTLTVSYGVRYEHQTHVDRGDAGARAGFAWTVGERHVIRAGAGLFFQRLEPDLTLDLLRLDGRRQHEVLVVDPSFFPVVPDQVSDLTRGLPTTYRKADGLRAPRVVIASVTYERRLPSNTFLTLGYGSQTGDRLLRTRNVNAPDADGAAPHPELGPVLQYESTGHLRRDDISLGWRWLPTNAVNVYANYVYLLRARSDTDGRRTAPADSRHPTAELGLPAGMRPHQFHVESLFTFPGDVLVSPRVVFESDGAFNITTGYDNNGDGLFTDRPGLASGEPNAIQTPYGWLTADPGTGAAIVPRNFGRAGRRLRADLHVSKRFLVAADRVVFSLAVDVLNVTNRANLAGFNGVLTSPEFGQPKRAIDPRRFDLSASLSF
jgi:hypothetical protein